MKFNSEMNYDWSYSNEGRLVSNSLNKELIGVGESKTIKLVLIKNMTSSNMGLTTNIAEISKSSNDMSVEDNDSQDNNGMIEEDDISKAELIISVKTGTIIGISITIVLMTLIIASIIIGWDKIGRLSKKEE